MAIAIWSYPNQSDFTAVIGELQNHQSFNPKLLKNSFVITPYNHTKQGFYTLPLHNAVKVNKAYDWF
ncbi:MAG: hypothetical protein ACPGLV_17485, partial [Bacteroidia bacterium]